MNLQKMQVAFSRLDLPLLHLKKFPQKKLPIKYMYLQTCNINFFLDHLFNTRQQIRVKLVSLTHQLYMACIRPGCCYA